MSELFKKSLGKTSWAGVNVPVADIWKAKGAFSLSPRFG